MSDLILASHTVLPEAEWSARLGAHERRVDDLVSAHRDRQRRGVKHPVEDFLFTYYSFRPTELRRWHPGVGTILAGNAPHQEWPGYVRIDTGVALDPSYVDKRAETVRWVRSLLSATASRPAFTGCLGLHEWAMVYRSDDIRHETWPLRLGRAGTDAVVDAQQIRCTHFDAFRFFTDDAAPRNTLQPTRARQIDLEQPGCLHANMDIYKWAYKLSPLVPSDLVADAFVLAREIREVDMRASPYDFTDLGYKPVKIETREGKREYIEAQHRFAEKAADLRARIIDKLDEIVESLVSMR